MIVSLNWTELKALLASKSAKLQYYEEGGYYRIFFAELGMTYSTDIYMGAESADRTDFEDNYKAACNEPLEPKDSEGKAYVRAESRPLNCTTCFTSCGDVDGGSPAIGEGPRMEWDASDPSGWTTDAAPSGYKQHETTISFCDSVWLKEGTIYYMDAKKGSYCDMEVICPSGYYFLYQGAVAQSQSDTQVVDHYLFKHPLQGDVPMGDELNTESCSQELPSYLRFRFKVTVPVTDTTSYGYMEMELYRVRTVVL